MPLIEKRYAQALFYIAKEKQLLDNYKEQLEEIIQLINTDNEFKTFLLNPKIKQGNKIDIIKKVLENKLNIEIINFIIILIKKGRIKSLGGILKEFNNIIQEEKNILEIKIISAVELDEKEIKEISEKYKKLYNANEVKVIIELDNSLIGGVKVQIGDKVIDGSIKQNLNKIKELITKN